MLLDLVSPWAATVEAADPALRQQFLDTNAPLLAALRRQRAPDQSGDRLATDPRLLRLLARQAASPAIHQRIQDCADRAAAAGADVPFDVVLLAGDARAEIVEPLPWSPVPVAALFVEHAGAGDLGARRLTAAVARAAAFITRWRAADSSSVLATPRGEWDRWEISRDVPLAEWIYADGVATHLGVALDSSLPLHVLLGISRGTLGRLRESERALRVRLEHDIALPGLGPLLRWMVRDAAPAVRMIDGHAIPPGAGRYLAYRLTEERVRNAGLRDALRGAV